MTFSPHPLFFSNRVTLQDLTHYVTISFSLFKLSYVLPLLQSTPLNTQMQPPAPTLTRPAPAKPKPRCEPKAHRSSFVASPHPCAPAHPASRHIPLILPVLPQCRSWPPPRTSPQLQAHAIFGLLRGALSSTRALVSMSQSVQLRHIIYLLSSLLRTYPNIVTVLLRLRRDFSSTWMQPTLLQWPCAQSVNSSGRPNCPPGLSVGHHCYQNHAVIFNRASPARSWTQMIIWENRHF